MTSPYWRWLLVALLLHAALLLGLKTTQTHPPEVTLSSGENATDVSLESEAETPPMTVPPAATPIPIPVPIPQPTQEPLPREDPVTPKPDDLLLPLPKATPLPASTPLPAPPKVEKPAPSHPSITPSTLPPSPSHPTHAATHPTQHHATTTGDRSGGAGNGKASYLDNPEPPYPESARDAQIEGRVDLMVSVNESGGVTAVHLVKSSGDLSLDQSALSTVRTRWKFRPAHTAGIPVSSQVLIPITFKLTQ